MLLQTFATYNDYTYLYLKYLNHPEGKNVQILCCEQVSVRARVCLCARARVPDSGLEFRVKYSKWRTEEQRVKMRVQDQVMITAFYIFILVFKGSYSEFIITEYWGDEKRGADKALAQRCFSFAHSWPSVIWQRRKRAIAVRRQITWKHASPLCVIRRLYAATYSYVCRQIQFSIFY